MGIIPRYYYNYYDNPNPWNEEVLVSYEQIIYQKTFFVEVAFDCLILLALFSFAIWACTIRNGSGPQRATIVVLVMFLISQSLQVIADILYLAIVWVKQSYVIAYILNYVFGLASYSLLFAVFYMIIHRSLDRLTDSGKPDTAVKVVHWVIVGIVTAVSIADFGLYTAVTVKQVESDLTYELVKSQRNLYAARCIIYFIVSFEILAWSIFVAVKARTSQFVSKTPVHWIVASSLCWFGYNIMYAIVAIRYQLNYSVYRIVPSYLGIIEVVFQFVFIVGIFTGILLSIMNWHKFGGGEVYGPAPVQYPYNATQGAYQHPQQGYQHQSYQQPQGYVQQQQTY
ncbi:hypothetical protein N7478_013060 [Penicillium angulare]|uniref:uncharacterized protein n=1 Tax=Penicillium angulare TaxID=116970 RepID=UPI0025406A9F|nr:uncharacterized protein N7478_013060 [Penicillium angulare]KAJ5256956.1 hypothetical protein N7478_013060 [Penicillium angulare]